MLGIGELKGRNGDGLEGHRAARVHRREESWVCPEDLQRELRKREDGPCRSSAIGLGAGGHPRLWTGPRRGCEELVREGSEPGHGGWENHAA